MLACVSLLKAALATQNGTINDARAAFNAQGWKGIGEVQMEVLQNSLRSADRLQVLRDLKGFTGLSEAEIMPRLQRQGPYHYAAEHAFWKPASSSELAWFYRSSVDYLFGLAWHGVEPILRGRGKYRHLQAEAPILEFSPGAGNNGLHLAVNAKVPYLYAGLSLLETGFAQYRAARRGLPESLFRVLMPYSNGGGWQLDPLAALRPGSPHHGQIGTILAFDVLEHIPHFERTVAAMVDALRPGGLLVEQSPFEDLGVDGNGTDTRLHISAGGVTMQAAMGPLMRMIGGSATKHRGKGTHLWRKQSTDGTWKDTCCIAGFSHMCKGWQRRCIEPLPNSSYK